MEELISPAKVIRAVIYAGGRPACHEFQNSFHLLETNKKQNTLFIGLSSSSAESNFIKTLFMLPCHTDLPWHTYAIQLVGRVKPY